MTVGWYVHHHGRGHRARMEAVLPFLEPTVLSSLPAPVASPPWVRLPLDVDPRPRDPTAHGTLHWVPLHHDGLRARTAAISGWIERARPAALVVDVSVEVALLARLHGVPTVVVAQRGRRDDPAHALAYAQAAAVVAPWTEATHRPEDGLPLDRLRWVGAIARCDGADSESLRANWRPGGDVLLVLGQGGHGLAPEAVRAAAAATPERTWHVAGPVRVEGPGVVDHGPEADVIALLERASVVVGSAGGNVVAEVAAARRPFVCLPQARPFDEQLAQAGALESLGVAEVRWTWPPAIEWRALLAAAEARDRHGWSALHLGDGGARLAAVVRDVARAR